MTPWHAGLVGSRTAIVAAALIAIAAATVVPNDASSAATERSAEGAVVVTAETATERGTGAGTIVALTGDDVRIVTAKHVATFGSLTVRFDGDRSSPARILSLMPGHDLAVIETTVAPAVAADLRAARVGTARSGEPVHVWGSGFDGPAYETASVTETGGALPDGPARGRYEVACTLCHRGDSGAGIFDARGDLVGIYVGYYTYDSGERVGVAELPADAVRAASASTDSTPKIARSNTALVPDAIVGSTGPPAATAARKVASINASSAPAAVEGSGTMVPASANAAR